ncbi:diacylglycerol kinase family lipid kinase, partial [Candidatus Bipolaricaulota bacterium]|nr:diacylglycerol kinase family lipid kinase [Candidatus Bipolaricaulota bacterium]
MDTEQRSYFLVVNLIAGLGLCKRLFPSVRKELDRRGISYDLHYTNEPQEAIDVARMGVDAGFTYVVAMGGDGTINEVANGLGDGGATLGVIPAGKGNDFARMMGIPIDPVRAIDALENGVVRNVDLGMLNGDRRFVNGVGIGIDAQVARDVLQSKRLSGSPAYFSAAIREVFRFKAFSALLETDEWSEQSRWLSVGIANGKYCGGGFKLAPRADVNDGRLDLAAIGDFPRVERLLRLVQARNGKHLGLRQVRYVQSKKIIVSSDEKLVAHMDGEPYRLPKERLTV